MTMDVFIFAESLTALKKYSGGRQQQICLESHFEKFFKCVERRKVCLNDRRLWSRFCYIFTGHI